MTGNNALTRKRGRWESRLGPYLTTRVLGPPALSPSLRLTRSRPQSALIGLDAATVRAMRPKRRVLLVRFISKALLNPYYRQEWVESPLPRESGTGLLRAVAGTGFGQGGSSMTFI